VLPPDEGSHRKADLSNRSSQEKGALFETAHPAAAGPYSRPDESGFWEGCGLSKPKTDYCRAFRGALQKGSTYEDLTARSILLRCPNLFATMQRASRNITPSIQDHNRANFSSVRVS
jgi:hypothetical protein